MKGSLGKTLFISIITLAILFPISVIFFNATNLELVLRSTTEISISGLLFLLSSFMALGIMIHMLIRYRERKSENAKILIGYFVFIFLSSLIQGIFDIYQFSGSDLEDFFTKSVYVLMGLSLLFISVFIFEIFKDGLEEGNNKLWYRILIIFVLVFSVDILRQIFVESVPDEEVIIFAMLLYIFILAIYSILAKSAFKLSRQIKEDRPEQSRACKFIGISGTILLVGYIMLVTYVILKTILGTLEILELLDYVAIATLAVGYLVLYLGFFFLMRVSSK